MQQIDFKEGLKNFHSQIKFQTSIVNMTSFAETIERRETIFHAEYGIRCVWDYLEASNCSFICESTGLLTPGILYYNDEHQNVRDMVRWGEQSFEEEYGNACELGDEYGHRSLFQISVSVNGPFAFFVIFTSPLLTYSTKSYQFKKEAVSLWAAGEGLTMYRVKFKKANIIVYDKWFNSILVSEETIFVQDSEFIASSMALPDPAWSMIDLEVRLRNVEVDIEMYRFIKMLTV